MIDLRSDTVTRPSSAMRQAMAAAVVGDDVYGEDPTVNQLEATAAEMLGKEAALYVPSGTQSNLIALLTHCERGDEYIVGQTAHTYRFEGGGAAVLGSIQPQPLDVELDGSIDLEKVRQAIKPDDVHFARSTLLCLENTTGGQALSLDYLSAARQLCNDTGLKLHLDGARFFNAAIATQLPATQLAAPFDSVSVCLSKGLGAPVGSVLIGTTDFILRARRWRKMLGGGMRQAGMMAAGGLYALQHHVDDLRRDHLHAAEVAACLEDKLGAECVTQATNMIHLTVPAPTLARLVDYLGKHDIWAPRPRWVFHRDVSSTDVQQVIDAVHAF